MSPEQSAKYMSDTIDEIQKNGGVAAEIKIKNNEIKSLFWNLKPQI